jgi:hypothetical protein
MLNFREKAVQAQGKMVGGFGIRTAGRRISVAVLAAAAVCLCAALPAGQAGAQAITTNVAPTKGRVSKQIFDPSFMRRGPYGAQSFKWFWQEVSPARSAARPHRWGQVVSIMDRARQTGKPVFGSRDVMAQIIASYGDILAAEAKRRNVSVPLLIAVIAVESGGNPRAVSPKGAGGLMQLMPATAERFGVSNSLAPAQNIRGGAHYLDWLLQTFDDDAVLALAGYNAGESAVEDNDGVPPFNETRDYVAKVAGAYALARQLCETPPRGPRDACKLR